MSLEEIASKLKESEIQESTKDIEGSALDTSKKFANSVNSQEDEEAKAQAERMRLFLYFS